MSSKILSNIEQCRIVLISLHEESSSQILLLAYKDSILLCMNTKIYHIGQALPNGNYRFRTNKYHDEITRFSDSTSPRSLP